MEKTNQINSVGARQKIFGLLGKYWWVLLIIAIGLFAWMGAPVLRYILYGIGIIVALMIFAPFVVQLFAPALYSISLLTDHFKQSKGQSVGKRYFFLPASIVAVVGFVTAQSILSIWVFLTSFFIWTSVVGVFFSFIGIFFFGLAPIAIVTAPFVVWIKIGLVEFIAVLIFFLTALFWYGFSKMAFPDHSWNSTPDDFLGYSPHTFLLGALSFQVIALPFYHFEAMGIGNFISDFGGFIFLVLALIASFKWRSAKKKLSPAEKENLYRPSAWVFFLGFMVTNLLYMQFQQVYDAPTAVLFWLNGFFLVVLIGRFFGMFKKKKQIELVPTVHTD
ncbi:hypothetical protein IPJ70_04405 [Candidatus Campbellbacteria bacterium]|nr:MAG: hypothetical protein IPJ70_04405 [Candidatus Campbellbacteria bacterium]